MELSLVGVQSVKSVSWINHFAMATVKEMNRIQWQRTMLGKKLLDRVVRYRFFEKGAWRLKLKMMRPALQRRQWVACAKALRFVLLVVRRSLCFQGTEGAVFSFSAAAFVSQREAQTGGWVLQSFQGKARSFIFLWNKMWSPWKGLDKEEIG